MIWPWAATFAAVALAVLLLAARPLAQALRRRQRAIEREQEKRAVAAVDRALDKASGARDFVHHAIGAGFEIAGEDPLFGLDLRGHGSRLLLTVLESRGSDRIYDLQMKTGDRPVLKFITEGKRRGRHETAAQLPTEFTMDARTQFDDQDLWDLLESEWDRLLLRGTTLIPWPDELTDFSEYCSWVRASGDGTRYLLTVNAEPFGDRFVTVELSITRGILGGKGAHGSDLCLSKKEDLPARTARSVDTDFLVREYRQLGHDLAESYGPLIAIERRGLNRRFIFARHSVDTATLEEFRHYTLAAMSARYLQAFLAGSGHERSRREVQAILSASDLTTHDLAQGKAARSATGRTPAGRPSESHDFAKPEWFGKWEEIEMVAVPRGDFTMGNPGKEITVYLDDFYIAKHPVTNAQYSCFVEETGRAAPASWRQQELSDPTQPVVCVSWIDAAAFCEWLSKRTGSTVRLPTSAEWEKAARGTDGRTYPWGEDRPSPERAHFGQQGASSPMSVGSHPEGVSPYGCHDMAGNVCEWVADWGGERPTGSDASRNPKGPASGSTRLNRGGGRKEAWAWCEVAEVFENDPTERDDDIGFRCARDG